jgi:hypothetical protein
MTKFEKINQQFQSIYPTGTLFAMGNKIGVCYQEGGKYYFFGKNRSLDSIARQLGLYVTPRNVKIEIENCFNSIDNPEWFK